MGHAHEPFPYSTVEQLTQVRCPDQTDDKQRHADLRKTGRNTKRRIVQNALQTEDMDQETFLKKVRARMDRCDRHATHTALVKPATAHADLAQLSCGI